MHPAFQIITRGAQIAQLLRDHHALIFGCTLNFCFFGRNVVCIQICDFRLTRCDVDRQLIIKAEGLFIKHIEAFDVLQQDAFMAVQVLCDLVDLALYLFKLGGELRQGCRFAQQFFPPALLAAHIQFINGETPDR